MLFVLFARSTDAPALSARPICCPHAHMFQVSDFSLRIRCHLTLKVVLRSISGTFLDGLCRTQARHWDMTFFKVSGPTAGPLRPASAAISNVPGLCGSAGHGRHFVSATSCIPGAPAYGRGSHSVSRRSRRAEETLLSPLVIVVQTRRLHTITDTEMLTCISGLAYIYVTCTHCIPTLCLMTVRPQADRGELIEQCYEGSEV